MHASICPHQQREREKKSAWRTTSAAVDLRDVETETWTEKWEKKKEKWALASTTVGVLRLDWSAPSCCAVTESNVTVLRRWAKISFFLLSPQLDIGKSDNFYHADPFLECKRRTNGVIPLMNTWKSAAFLRVWLFDVLAGRIDQFETIPSLSSWTATFVIQWRRSGECVARVDSLSREEKNDNPCQVDVYQRTISLSSLLSRIFVSSME